jgi:O-antigen/teichoic acid export membrane protein
VSGVPRSVTRPTPFSALRWTLAGSLVQRIASVAGLAIIARLLSAQESGKEIYGAYRQIISLHSVVFVLLPLGFNQLVVREAAGRDSYVRALRGALITAAAVVVVAVLAAQPMIARLLGLGGSAPLLWFFPLVVITQTIKLGIKPLLVAELAFRRINSGEFLNSIVMLFGGAALLVLRPASGMLYAAYAAGEVVEVLWLWRGRDLAAMSRIKESFAEFRARLGQHRRFCTFLTLDQVLNTLSSNAPALMLGGLIGQQAVGVFAMANALVGIPVLVLVGAIARVTFPALAGRGEASLQDSALRVLRGAAAFIPPVLLWLVFFAPAVAHLILGKSWAFDVAALLRWLALYLIFVSLFSPISSIDVLRDRPDVTLIWNIGLLSARAGALAWGARYSVETAIAAFAVASSIMWLIYGGVLAWLLRCGWARFFGAWLGFTPLWALAAAGWWVVCALMDPTGIPALIVSVVPALLYLTVLRIAAPQTFGLIRRLTGTAPAVAEETMG